MRFAWEHFKFHAEQRTRMFHFFLIAVGLLVTAFSLMTRSNGSIYQDYAFILLCIGGVLSTFFLCLDVRNAQLLKLSERLLQKIEEDFLYKDWTGKVGGKKIKLGILSREAVLENYIQSNKEICSGDYVRWFSVDNIKHKISMRAIEWIGILGFWIGAEAVILAKDNVPLLQSTAGNWVLIGLTVCVFWAGYALGSPERDLKREEKALKALQEESSSGKG